MGWSWKFIDWLIDTDSLVGLATPAGVYFYSVFLVVLYVFISRCFQEMARKKAYPHPWIAWIPVLNIYLMCKLGRRGIVLTILLLATAIISGFFSIVGVVVFILMVYLMMRIARNFGRPRAYGLLLIAPVVIGAIVMTIQLILQGFGVSMPIPTWIGHTISYACLMIQFIFLYRIAFRPPPKKKERDGRHWFRRPVGKEAAAPAA